MARTVGWHLRNVFTKLDIRSSKELRRGAARPRTGGCPGLARLRYRVTEGARRQAVALVHLGDVRDRRMPCKLLAQLEQLARREMHPPQGRLPRQREAQPG